MASELITEPPLILLDEPTSGLDSYMAENITAQLKRLAESGRTVVATIHQPSTDVFKTFDKVMLLTQGHLAYSGRTSELVAYFATVGFACPKLTNPAEFVLEVLSLDKDRLDQSQQNIDSIVSAFRPTDNLISVSGSFNKIKITQAPMGLQIKLLVKRTFVQMKRNPV